MPNSFVSALVRICVSKINLIGIRSLAEQSRGDSTVIVEEDEHSAKSAGFLKFYGLYWDKQHLQQILQHNEKLLLGIPAGWTGKGTRGLDRSTLWMNFLGTAWHICAL